MVFSVILQIQITFREKKSFNLKKKWKKEYVIKWKFMLYFYYVFVCIFLQKNIKTTWICSSEVFIVTSRLKMKNLWVTILGDAPPNRSSPHFIVLLRKNHDAFHRYLRKSFLWPLPKAKALEIMRQQFVWACGRTVSLVALVSDGRWTPQEMVPLLVLESRRWGKGQPRGLWPRATELG